METHLEHHSYHNQNMINSIMVFFMRDSCQEYINNLPEIMFYAKEICHLPLPKTKFSIVVYTSNIKA